MPRKSRDTQECICETCGCGILDHEERAQQSMTGTFGCVLTYWHSNDRNCIRALLEKVQQLEALVARQALKLERKKPKEDRPDE